jgi:hypothetical protein
LYKDNTILQDPRRSKLSSKVTFKQTINSYIHCSLTKQEDSLNAISAILNYLQDGMFLARFLFGLPVKHFQMLLL